MSGFPGAYGGGQAGRGRRLAEALLVDVVDVRHRRDGWAWRGHDDRRYRLSGGGDLRGRGSGSGLRGDLPSADLLPLVLAPNLVHHCVLQLHIRLCHRDVGGPGRPAVHHDEPHIAVLCGIGAHDLDLGAADHQHDLALTLHHEVLWRPPTRSYPRIRGGSSASASSDAMRQRSSYKDFLADLLEAECGEQEERRKQRLVRPASLAGGRPQPFRARPSCPSAGRTIARSCPVAAVTGGSAT
ncbi:hypothetical protein DMT42_34150 [Streptomyces actuosus]|uniref:Uncharacterized protein n=1 Tax=Streptomyces actuosus TaxID=1885 RepID=A0A2U9PD81_STRAS|nr:hypothetical protein DMT42_34150 [Streptomyces actuosus]